MVVLLLGVLFVTLTPLTAYGQESEPAGVAPAAPAAVEPGGPDAPGNGAAGPEQQQPGFSFTSMLPLYVGLFLLWYLIVIRPQSNQRNRRAELLAAIKKNDKVVTTGGIVGTVSSVHEATGEISIKSNDTSLRLQREAIREVVEPPKDES